MEKIVTQPKDIHGQSLVAVCASGASLEELTGKPVLDAATQLSSWMALSGSMLPKTPGELVDLIQQGKYVVLVAEGQVVAGCGTTFVFSGPTENGDMVSVPEVGGLVVNPSQRKKGFGTDAAVAYVSYAQEKDPTSQHIVFVNGLSTGIFTGALDAKPMTKAQIVATMPRTIFTEGCATCPRRPVNWDADAPMSELAAACCDTPCSIPSRRSE